MIRYLFALAGVQYEDIRIEMDDWHNKKSSDISVPFGKLPILSIDGVVYSQSFAIGRHLAEKFGYAGKTELEKLKADMIVHCCEDLIPPMIKIREEKDEEKKAALTAKFRDEDLKQFFTNIDKLLKENNGGDGFFVGDSLTWADLTFYQYVTFIKFHGGIDYEPFLAAFPKLKALRERVEKVPQIAAWMAKRPDNAV